MTSSTSAVRDADHFVAKLFDDQFGRVGIDGLVLCYHHAVVASALLTTSPTRSDIRLASSDTMMASGTCTSRTTFSRSCRAAHRLLPGALLLALHRCHRTLPTAFAARKRLIQRQLAGPAVVHRPWPTAIVSVCRDRVPACGRLEPRHAPFLFALGCQQVLGRWRRWREQLWLWRRLLRPLPCARSSSALAFSAFFALALFAFLGFGLGPAAFAFFLTCLFFGRARSPQLLQLRAPWRPERPSGGAPSRHRRSQQAACPDRPQPRFAAR